MRGLVYDEAGKGTLHAALDQDEPDVVTLDGESDIDGDSDEIQAVADDDVGISLRDF